MIPLAYILLNLIHAVYHKHLIDKGRLILSRQKVVEYLVMAISAGVVLKLVLDCPILPLIFFAILTRLAFFDALLNLLRSRPIYYEGTIDRKKSGFDWFESKLKIPIWLLRLIYIAGYLFYLIIYLT